MKPAAAAVSTLAAVLLATVPAAGATLAEGDVAAAGDPVPVVSTKGEPVDLRAAVRPADDPAAVDAKATLLVFWGTWCGPCLHEVPEIREIGRFYAKKGLRVVSVATTWRDDTLEKVVAAAKSNGIDYQVLFDNQDNARQAFGVTSLPTSFLIDHTGRVAWRGNLLPGDINARIKAALGSGEERGPK